MIDLSGVRPIGLSQAHYDLDAVVAGLRATATNWVPSHFRNGRRMGDEMRLANIHGDKPRKQGSCVIALEGERAGDWIDFDDNQGGGPLSTLEHATGLTGRGLIEYAADLAGCAPVNGASHPIAEAISKEQRSDNIAREIELILARGAPLVGTAGEAYLVGRGLQVPDTSDLLFHPDLTYWDTRTGYPALIAIVRDARGQQIAIHRTYLAPDGPIKADVPKPRMMLGSVAGGAVRLGNVGERGVVGLAEGIETALSVMHACPHLPVWAGLSSGNLEQVVLPREVTRVVLFADHDGEGVGLKVAERAAGRFHAEGRRVWIAHPPDAGDDFNDLLLKQGSDVVRQVVEAAAAWQLAPQRRAQQPQAAAPELGTHRALGFRGPTSPLPQMRADDGDLARLTNRSWSLLFAANIPPWLYRCGGGPSWVERDNDGRSVPRPMTDDRLRHVLAQLVNWRKKAKDGDLVPAYPPPVLLKNLLATPDPALPVLAGIVTAPVFGSDGTLITEAGYHPATRVLGKSEMVRFPIRCVWIATGNNPQFSNEIARRMVRIRLDPHEDQPWLREGFRHPNLLAWVWQNRAHLVTACLTLGRAWIAAGMPRHQKTIGSFEGWAQVMGGILEVASVPGFLGNLKEMYEKADAEGGVWRGFVGLWWDRFGTRPVTSADLCELAIQCSIPMARGDEHAKRTSLGKALGRMRDRIYTVGGRRLRVHHAGSAHGAQRWQLQVSESDAGSTSPTSPLEFGAGSTSPTSLGGGEGLETSPEPHPENRQENQCSGEVGEGGEVVSPLRVRAHVCAMEGPGKSSPTSPGSPSPTKPPSSGGEVRGEPLNRPSPGSNGHWEEVI